MSMRWMHPRRAFGWAFAAFLGLIGVLIVASLIAWAIRGFAFGFPFGFGFGWIFLLLYFLFFWGRWWGWGPWGWGGRPYGSDRDDAHAILRARYARGEITKEQFDQMRRDLDLDQGTRAL